MAKFAVYLEDWPAKAEPLLVKRLAKMTGRSEQSVRRRMARRPVRLVKSVDHTKVRKLKELFEKVGAELTVEPVDAVVQSSVPASDPASSAHSQDPSTAAPPSGVIPVTEAYSMHPSELPEASSSATSLHGRQVGVLPSPMSLGDRWQGALSRLWHVSISAFAAAVLLIGLAALVTAGCAFAAGLLEGDIEEQLQVMQNKALMLLAVWVVVLLVGWWLALLLQLPARTLAMGERPRFSRMFGDAWAKIPDMIVVIAVFSFLAMFVVVPVWAWVAQTPFSTPIRVALIGIGTVLLLWPLFLAAPVAAVESDSCWRSFGRGWRLAAGRRLSLLISLVIWLGLTALMFLIVEQAAELTGASLASVLPLAIFSLAALVASSYLLADVLHSHYAEARVLKESWAPGWMETLDSSWPLGRDAELPPASGGWTAWLSALLVLLLVSAALLFLPKV